MILKGEASAHYSFSKGTSKQNYPSSRMGAIALLRQTYYDGKWYAEDKNDKTYNISLEEWNKTQRLPQFFHLRNRLDLLRADKLGDEFGVQYIFTSGGDEFLRLDAIKKTNGALVVPMHFPKAYDVSDPYDAEEVNLTQMKYWELAPTNPARLAAAGIPFAITSNLNKDKKDFWKQVRKAYQHGLSEKDLLKALTTTPAKLIKAENQIGTLEKNKLANFIITSDNILNEKVVFYHNWVKGKPYVIKDLNAIDIRGRYNLSIDNKSYQLEVKGTATSPVLSWMNEQDTSKKHKLKHQFVNNTISFTFVPEKDTTKKVLKIYRLSGNVTSKKWSGQATKSDGTWITWGATRTGDIKTKASKLPKMVELENLGEVLYPWSPYGYTKANLPKKETVLIQNVTVWTGEDIGNLEATDVLVKDGKIAKIGKKLNTTGAKIIDGKGKHLTAGTCIVNWRVEEQVLNCYMVLLIQLVDNQQLLSFVGEVYQKRLNTKEQMALSSLPWERM